MWGRSPCPVQAPKSPPSERLERPLFRPLRGHLLPQGEKVVGDSLRTTALTSAPYLPGTPMFKTFAALSLGLALVAPGTAFAALPKATEAAIDRQAQAVLAKTGVPSASDFLSA